MEIAGSWRLATMLLVVGGTLALLITVVQGDVFNIDQFFYASDKEHSSPIQEFVAANYPLVGSEISPDRRPDFLYSSEYPKARVVEFYAHWCPHCRHFKNLYIEFGKSMEKMMETLPSDVDVEFWAVSCVPNQPICKDFNIGGYPSLFVFPAHSTNGTKAEHWNLHPFPIFRMAGISIESPTGGAEDTHPEVGKQQYQEEVNGNQQQLRLGAPSVHDSANDAQVEQHFMAKTREDIFNDAHLSFDFAMKTAVFTTEGSLPQDRRQALQPFLRHLQKSLPPSSTMHPLLTELNSKFNKIVRSDKAFQFVVEQNPPPTTKWSPACLQHGSGYTCGLWHLFHMYTIGLVEYNSMALSADTYLQPTESADVLRNYVANFFGCEECRLHFLQQYDDCLYDRCNRLSEHAQVFDSWIEFPLWLFEFHNAVNSRLRKERLQRREIEHASVQDVMFPPTYECPECWLSSGRWDEQNSYKYLRLRYWPEDPKSKEYRDELFQIKMEQQHAARNLHYDDHDEPNREYHERKSKVDKSVSDETGSSAYAESLDSHSIVVMPVSALVPASFFIMVVGIYVWHRRQQQHFVRKGLQHKVT